MYLPALKKYNLLLSAIVFVVLFSSCKSSPVAGPEYNVPAGRRDYVWTVDTISNLVPTNSYYYLWGTSPSNLWCIGDIGDYNKMILNNDGTGWKVFPHAWDGLWVEPSAIFGFSADDFWIGGRYSDLWRYKNKNFYKFGIYNLPGYSKTVITRFWGNSSDNLLATGTTFSKSHDSLFATLLKFDGKDWSYLIKPDICGQFLDIRRESLFDSIYFLNIYKTTNTSNDSAGIMKYDGKKLEMIYHTNVTPYYNCGMAVLQGHVYFGFQKKIFTYRDCRFKLLADLSNYNIFTMTKFDGRTIKDIFMTTEDGIGHYNGTDVKTLIKMNNIVITSMIILENEVFFLCPDKLIHKFYIIHGKLK